MTLEPPKKYAQLWHQAEGSSQKKVPRQTLATSEHLQGYLTFLAEAKVLMLEMKGKLSKNTSSAAEACHQRALKLGLITHVK